MKILHNLCLHFARQDGQGGKKLATSNNQNTKSQKMKIGDQKNFLPHRKQTRGFHEKNDYSGFLKACDEQFFNSKTVYYFATYHKT